MKQLAAEPAGVPFGGAYSYGGLPGTVTWDEDKIYGCVCDSAWEVGYGAGQTQAAQFYGTDCSLRRCPSGDDPRTPDTVETDCEYADDVSGRAEWVIPRCCRTAAAAVTERNPVSTDACANGRYPSRYSLFPQNGSTWRGYLGSDGLRYKTALSMAAGVTVATTPAGNSARKADALAPGEVANAGASGNLCHVECANRGTCDAATGTCRCFSGYYGEACARRLDYLG